MIEEDSITTTIKDKASRPKNLTEYIGQAKAKEQLQIFMQAAIARGESVDHILIQGAAGLGKTTLANIVATTMQGELTSTSGIVIDKTGDLAALLTGLQEHAILFIDEIHKLNSSIIEMLYPAMEDYELDIMIGDGTAARSIKINLPQFTIIGATTKIGALPLALRTRFGINIQLEDYTKAELMEIITINCNKAKMLIKPEATALIATCSRGTPRIANQLIRRIRDYCQVQKIKIVDQQAVQRVLNLLEIDNLGLTKLDRKILRIIRDAKTIGLDNLAVASGEHKSTIEESLEPYLMKIGILKRTSKGRKINPEMLKNISF